MDAMFVTLMYVLLLPALTLVVMSWRTSRRYRSRHQGYMAVAMLLGAATLLLTLLSLSVHLADAATVDPWLAFFAPVLTLACCALVGRRGMVALGRGRGRGR